MRIFLFLIIQIFLITNLNLYGLGLPALSTKKVEIKDMSLEKFVTFIREVYKNYPEEKKFQKK